MKLLLNKHTWESHFAFATVYISRVLNIYPFLSFTECTSFLTKISIFQLKYQATSPILRCGEISLAKMISLKEYEE
jgi:hypothetical protein